MHTNQQIKIGGQTISEIQRTGQLLNYSDLADYLKMSEHTLRRFVMERKIPFTKIGKCVRFSPGAISEWIKTKSVNEGV